MDLFRNFISTFHKRSLLKPQKTVITTKDTETNQLEQPEDKTNDTIRNTIDVEVKGTPEINVLNNTKIAKVTSQNDDKNMNEKVKERKFDDNIKESFSNNASDFRIIERLLNNTSVSIVKVGSNVTKVKVVNNDQSTNMNAKNEFDNSSYENELTASNLNTVNMNNNKTTVNENNSSKASPTDFTNAPNMAVFDEVNTNVTAENSSGNSNIQDIKEETMKHLKEFDDVLAKVKKQDNAVIKYDAETISLDDIDEILNESLENSDSTYSFQEIKHCDNESMNTKIDDSSNKTEENTLKPDSHNVENLIETNQILDSQTSSKVKVDDKSDIISISSDDTPNLDNKDAINCKNSENRALKTVKESPTKIGNVKISKPEGIHIVDTIPIRSEEVKPENEEDSGYHSSDFEFITEQEAEMDGLIIHYKSKINSEDKHDLVEGPSANWVLTDPGPSRSEEFEDKIDVIEDESSMENYAVPQENEFLNMFHEIIPGIPNCEIRFLENKSVRTRTPMLVQYEGIGFDMNLAMMRGVESSDEEYRDEAKETLNKILQIYPTENTKRKRRRRY